MSSSEGDFTPAIDFWPVHSLLSLPDSWYTQQPPNWQMTVLFLCRYTNEMGSWDDYDQMQGTVAGCVCECVCVCTRLSLCVCVGWGGGRPVVARCVKCAEQLS